MEPKFDPDDVVRVRGQPNLVGSVAITYEDISHNERLEDLLILSHTQLPGNVLSEFMKTGKPPWGYVFVVFINPHDGSSLIHEDDLELIDRLFELGRPVKRHPQSPFSGTVIGASAKCDLRPIAYQPINPLTGDYGPLRFTEKPVGRAVWPSLAGSNDDGPIVLRDVPMAELTDYEPFCEDDYIIYRQRVGKIRSIDRDAALLLPNHKVTTLHEYSRIETFIMDGTKNPLSMPDRLDLIHTRTLPDGRQIWSSELEAAVAGQYAFTSASNMNRNDLKSDTGPDVEPEGYVLATPATEYTIDWICPNPFALSVAYDDPTTQRCRATSIHEHAVKCDFGQLPKDAQSNDKSARNDTWLEIGDSIRFRDPADATRRYPQYRHIPTDESFGYDLNILQIVTTKTEVTVRWQDGSITTENSVCLRTFNQAEEEVWPGDLVVLKDSMEIRREPRPAAPSDENQSDPTIENYRLKKVGVVQTVDSEQRIASVRWYENPDVELTHAGKMMKAGSSLGALGSVVTDVSLYEITTYSGISPYLDAMVLLVPDTVHEATVPPPDMQPMLHPVGPCRISLLAPFNMFKVFVYLESMKVSIARMEWFKNSVTIDTARIPSRLSLQYTGYNVNKRANYFGRIVSMDTDGFLTVRLAASNNCHDIRVSLDWLMLVIDENRMSFLPEDDDEMDEGFGYSDEDSMDIENESTHDIHELAGADFETPVVSDIVPPQEPEADDEVRGTGTDPTETPPVPEESITASSPTECPPAFALLDGPPPSDHRYLASEQSGFSGKLIKCIHKEYDILRSSLPPGIIVRAWESRIDLLRVLIFGPQGTPYEYAPFVFDFLFTSDFPSSPPRCSFHSWTNNTGRINPNLYENGTVCLSILGTWTANNPEESWSAKSTVLQILVSIMGLVLVKAPFYNEAGYETFAEEGAKKLESAQYTEKAFMMTRKFIQHALQQPVAGMEDVLTWHYLPATAPQEGSSERPRLLRRAIDSALGMIENHNCTTADDELNASAFIPRLSLGGVVMLRKHVTVLEGIESAQDA